MLPPIIKVTTKGINIENVLGNFLLDKNFVVGKSSVASKIANRIGNMKSFARTNAAQINPKERRLKLSFL